MILRRITEHVKAQNWTAVALDFVIVVVGVFIGIQVANWNEARAFRAQEDAYLAQLHNEIASNTTMIDYQTRFVERVVASSLKTLSYVEGEQECSNDCELALINAFHASQVWGTGYAESKFQEMSRLGLPSDANVRSRVEAFFNFIDGWDVVNAAPPEYRERVRGAISPQEAAILWDGCYRITGGTYEELTTDCVEDLRSLDIAPTLQRIRNDTEIARMLRFWAGQNEYALRFYPDMRVNAEAAMSAIDQALEER
jgi:hypothetical protein